MNRREFLKIGGMGALTLFLSGCGLSALAGENNPEGKVPERGSASGGKKMKIALIAGSPHEAGTSALLADKFIEGAENAGHTVFRFNAAFEDTHPCRGCDHCGMNGPCVYQDAVETKLMPRLLEADFIALVTPLYYYGMSAQLKIIIDRFYSRTGSIAGKKSVLMATAYNSADWTMNALVNHYDTLVRYMKWSDAGKVLAVGCGSRSLIERSNFPEQAYRIGANL